MRLPRHRQSRSPCCLFSVSSRSFRIRTRAQDPKVINITAKRFEFSPNQITLKKGEPVKLLLTSANVTHGFFLKAADPAARMRFEIVEFQNRKKAVAPYSITDIGVSYMGLEVSDLDRLFARLKGAGVTIVSDGIVTMTGGYRVAMVRDLDTGAFVELFERPKQ